MYNAVPKDIPISFGKLMSRISRKCNSKGILALGDYRFLSERNILQNVFICVLLIKHIFVLKKNSLFV